MARDGWAQNAGTRLHYLESGGEEDPSLTPVVFIPGMLGAAEDFSQTMHSLSPRQCVALSLRGRGNSDSPDGGYAFQDHVSDIGAVLAHLNLKRFCLMAYSMGGVGSRTGAVTDQPPNISAHAPTVVYGFCLVSSP
ncbi:MAG: alpha/beta fold hydrolase, partial [Armatimonadetes bacterium]|nr:alpha/beta fold hydrolase [Armatimonadota bacterium]